MAQYESHMAKRKKQLFSMIKESSTVLDLGIGTGPNFAYLPAHTSVIGVEPNEYMWPYAREHAQEFGIKLVLLRPKGELLGLPSASVDVAITTLTLCSVANIVLTLREIDRVLRPGGIYIFIEHVLASERRPILRATQKVLSPLQQLLADGCHLDRDTAKVIVDTLTESMQYIHFESFDAEFGGIDNGISLIKPHIAGYAQKRYDVSTPFQLIK